MFSFPFSVIISSFYPAPIPEAPICMAAVAWYNMDVVSDPQSFVHVLNFHPEQDILQQLSSSSCEPALLRAPDCSSSLWPRCWSSRRSCNHWSLSWICCRVSAGEEYLSTSLLSKSGPLPIFPCLIITQWWLLNNHEVIMWTAPFRKLAIKTYFWAYKTFTSPHVGLQEESTL